MKKKSPFLLFCMAVMLALAPTARGEERISLSFPASVGTGRMQAELEFRSDWFAGDAHLYQHGLCRLSLGMALAAFRGTADAPDRNIRAFFDALDFSHVEVQQFDVTAQDTIGTAIAHRITEGPEGLFPVVAIAVSGGNYGAEWLSNFDTGVGDVHQGFQRAAEETVRRAETYVQEQGLENPRFWVSGYSRGAAVSNLAAALLNEQGLAEDENIFSYTFATPRTVRGDQKGAHPNIFNIVNVADLVPQVPLADWGFGRCGRTLYLPSSLCTEMDYAALLPAYTAAYENLTGQAPDSAGDNVFAAMASAAAHGLFLSVQTPERYTAHYQSLLGKLFLGQELTAAEQVLTTTLIVAMSNAALGDSGVGRRMTESLESAMQSLSGLLPIFYQHMPEIYFSWLLALPDGEMLLNNSLTLTEAPVL